MKTWMGIVIVAGVLGAPHTLHAAKLREAGPVLTAIREDVDALHWEDQTKRGQARTRLQNEVEPGLTRLQQIVEKIGEAPELRTRRMGITVERERQDVLSKIRTLYDKARNTRGLALEPACCAWRDAIAEMKRQTATLTTELNELRTAITAKRDEIRRRAERADDDIADKFAGVTSRTTAVATLKREMDTNEQQLVTLENEVQAAIERRDKRADADLDRRIDALVETIDRQQTDWDRACRDYDNALTLVKDALDAADAYPEAQRLWEAELD
jgi:chromosome segregation ATPase